MTLRSAGSAAGLADRSAGASRERRVMAEDAILELAQRRPWRQAQVVDEVAVRGPVDVQRLRLPPGSIEGEHDQLLQPFASRMALRLRGQLRDQAGVPSETELAAAHSSNALLVARRAPRRRRAARARRPARRAPGRATARAPRARTPRRRRGRRARAPPARRPRASRTRGGQTASHPGAACNRPARTRRPVRSRPRFSATRAAERHRTRPHASRWAAATPATARRPAPRG